MPTDITKIKLGPCKVTFDADGAQPVVFETTQGGVTMTYEEETREITVDQYGNTPVKELVIGRTATIEVPFAEYDLEKLATIIPGATLVVNGTDPNKKRIEVNANNVIDLFDYAKKVKLEPLNGDPNDAVIFFKAAPRPQLNYTYSYEGELITNVTFKAYPDSDGKLLAFGDETA